jgi:hypothetical protein
MCFLSSLFWDQNIIPIECDVMQGWHQIEGDKKHNENLETNNEHWKKCWKKKQIMKMLKSNENAIEQ